VLLAATSWNEFIAIATAGRALLVLALVIAAFIAARYARRDIEVQLKALERRPSSNARGDADGPGDDAAGFRIVLGQPGRRVR
jgi:hypothetical protein